MTKAAELAILDTAIAQLGPRSYLGPWLASVRPEIEASIRSDLEPAPILPAEAERRARQILEDANAQAAEIVTKARETMTKEQQAETTRLAFARARARRQLETIAADL